MGEIPLTFPNIFKKFSKKKGSGKMPALAIKAVGGLLVAAYLFLSGLSGIIPHDNIEVQINSIDSTTCYGSIKHKKETIPFIIYLEEERNEINNSRVKMRIKKDGRDIDITYDRENELTSYDKKIINKIIESIDKPGNGIAHDIKKKFINGLRKIVTVK